MTTPADPFEPYLNRAASLFDLGDVVQAGQIWQAILKKNPDHQVARAGLYKVKVHFDVRATQGGLIPPEPPAPATEKVETGKWATLNAQAAEAPEIRPEPVPQPAAPIPAAVPLQPFKPVEEDAEVLLRDGCTLFEMGEVSDALLKWERILAFDPGHKLARAYANDARKDLGMPALGEGEAPPPAPEAAPASQAAAESMADDDAETQAELMVRSGVQIYELGMLDEAIAKWEQVLELEPDNRNAKEYLAMAQKDLRDAAAAPKRPVPPPSQPVRMVPAEIPAPRMVTLAPPVSLPPMVQKEPPAPALRAASTPPKAITTRSTPAREGMKVPGLVSEFTLPPWLSTPRNFALALAGFLVLVAGLYFLREHQREAALRSAVQEARAEALKPVARQVEVSTLTETPEAIRKEAGEALSEDPLLAYFRAQECLRLDATNSRAARILEEARTHMNTQPGGGSKDAFEKLLKAGELEAAGTSIRSLLRENPDDAELKSRARIVNLALSQHFASTGQFEEAKICLCLVRAMYPQETIWQAKLRLLEAIRTLPKAEQAGWIQMLG